MTSEEALYTSIGQNLRDAVQSQMFGKPCFKIRGKAFMSFFNRAIVFKLTGDIHEEALSLDGTKAFDPSEKNRPMKEWVQVPYHYKDLWPKYAEAALRYVGSL